MALVVLFLFFSVKDRQFSSAENVQAMAVAASIPMVLVTGMTFVILMGAIDLSIEGVVAVGSVMVALLVSNGRTNLAFGLAAIVVTILFGGVFGAVNGLLNAKLRVPSFMATLATWSLGLGLAVILMGPSPIVLVGTGLRSLTDIRWVGFAPEVFLGVGVIILGWILERYTKFGRYARAIGGDERVARDAGLHIDRYKVYVFAFAGAMSALAGVMLAAQLGVGDAGASTGYLFSTITAVVVGGTLLTGGRGGVLQSLVGVLIVTVLNNGMIELGISPSWLTGIQGTLIVLAVVASNWPLREKLRIVK